MRAPIVLVKLGGSLVTEKSKAGMARRAVIRRLAGEIARGRARVIVGHGSGSFGHWAASRAGMGRGRAASRRPEAIAHVQRRAAELHRLIVAALEESSARPYSLAPSSFLTASAGRVSATFLDPLFRALDTGLLPVVYGDVVMDRKRGASILSTEEVFVAIAKEALRRRIKVARVIWLGETDGIMDASGRTIPVLSSVHAAREAKGAMGASGPDVTGGIALRLETVAKLARMGIASHLLDGRRKGAAAQAIAGSSAHGTWVEAVRRR